MWLFSNKIFWGPLYVWFLWLLYKQFPKQYWTLLLTILVMIIASDQLCNLSKDSFMRLRPTNEEHLQGLIHTVNGYTGGMYGFYSGHASNSFAVAVFMIASVSKGRKYIIPAALVYAILTSYSRIYLGVHYPGDVITGMIAGSLLGLCFAFTHKLLRNKYLKPE
jgi:undecaprenyl-diphosphatase